MSGPFRHPIYFLAAKRTPFGSFLGALNKRSATDLGVSASQAVLLEAQIAPDKIDHVIFGNVLQTAKDAIYLARHIGLNCEIPQSVPALTVNRLCGSGFEAIIQGAHLINGELADCVLVGGSENMSQAPHVIRGARNGIRLGQGQLEDSLWECLNDTFVDLPMGMTAENLAIQYDISQEEVDQYSLRSQQLYQEALKKGAFKEELIEVQASRDSDILSKDEHPREDASLEAIRKLPKVFKKDGVIHAGAASGISDGAAALIMCSQSFLDKNDHKPLGELLSFGISGCDPRIMGIGPVNASKICLERTPYHLSDMDMVEINEAFAPQVLAVQKALSLDMAKLNTNGGAIAIGHPLAASGARIAGHLLHNLNDNALGLGSACIGGGQGIAILLKKVGP